MGHESEGAQAGAHNDVGGREEFEVDERCLVLAIVAAQVAILPRPLLQALRALAQAMRSIVHSSGGTGLLSCRQ